ncbi:DNA polymerase III subunit chi [Solimonas marina]|uniref:DNA polymerase III subunit chi n=1 Tax=Solimonas marina TaxID=2714601 RepID=A0A969WEI7_9GAMM|nr:DNA polymerase III subunit chi [Solimonas marina]NKF23295.1 DNA polymerase III subunit chi [Solimonas marina]
MTRIDFYILPDGGAAGAPVATACRLCEKATAGGHRIYVNVPDEAIAGDLDDALWSLRQGGFIPHERYDGEPLDEPLPSVLIGAVEPPDSHHGIMLNLGLEVPDFFSRFERVLEIVAADPQARAMSRERYKFYRDRGYELATHKL